MKLTSEHLSVVHVDEVQNTLMEDVGLRTDRKREEVLYLHFMLLSSRRVCHEFKGKIKEALFLSEFVHKSVKIILP